MAEDRSDPELDRELPDLPPELRWREWMRRIEAVLLASASPVSRDDLARVVGQGASVDLLVEDLAADLEGRAFEIAQVAGGWIFRTRVIYAPAIRAAADGGCRGVRRCRAVPSLVECRGLPWLDAAPLRVGRDQPERPRLEARRCLHQEMPLRGGKRSPPVGAV